jgi:ParB/RepB/Spo0J family partition protein
MRVLKQYQAYSIPASAIYYDSDFNCRGEFTLQSVRELAESIREAGRLICPVAVQPWTEAPGFQYRLIVGHRRFRAATAFLKWTTIPAYVCKGLSDHDARMLNFAENLHRKSLNILEEAHAIRNIYAEAGGTLTKVAKELKQPLRWVWTRVRLLKMPEVVQQKAAAGLLTAANISALNRFKTAEEQIKAATKIAEARNRGKGKHLPGLEKEYQHRRGNSRNRTDINHLVERLLQAGITGLPTRVAAWCAGHVPDEELWAEIDAATLNRVPVSDLLGAREQ